jgi:hypothetical protein
MTRCELELLAANVTKVYLNDRTILFSYTTPVAVTFHEGRRRYVTDRAGSRTTAKHLSQYGPQGEEVEQVSPERLKEIAAG